MTLELTCCRFPIIPFSALSVRSVLSKNDVRKLRWRAPECHGGEERVRTARPQRWKLTLLALVLFGISFGYVEAAVVIYLRSLTEPVRARVYSQAAANNLFPLLTPEELHSQNQGKLWGVLKIELLREFATLVMLAAIALAVSRSRTEGVAAFAVAFGVWDLAFYAFLRLLIGWPASLFTWDLLFLLPVPWCGPVLAPAIVSVTMIGAGAVVLRNAGQHRATRMTRLQWLSIYMGGLIVVISFTWNYRRLLQARLPHTFPWPVFLLGEALGISGFVRGWLKTTRLRPSSGSASLDSDALTPAMK